MSVVLIGIVCVGVSWVVVVGRCCVFVGLFVLCWLVMAETISVHT